MVFTVLQHPCRARCYVPGTLCAGHAKMLAALNLAAKMLAALNLAAKILAPCQGIKATLHLTAIVAA